MSGLRAFNLLESDKGLEELLYSLKKRGILFNSKNHNRVVQRIAIIAVKLGFKDYKSFLEHLETYPEDWDEIIHWLKKGRVYNALEKTFSPLVTVNTILESASNAKK
ncbi:MAG: hypothetical protein ACW97X_13360, partial [Candidatus Hodarchaeales archaeon]